jgi:hypothetical protein
MQAEIAGSWSVSPGHPDPIRSQRDRRNLNSGLQDPLSIFESPTNHSFQRLHKAKAASEDVGQDGLNLLSFQMPCICLIPRNAMIKKRGAPSGQPRLTQMANIDLQ